MTLKLFSTLSKDLIIVFEDVKESAAISHIGLDRLKSRTSLALTALEK
ncbi:hypothetical protein HMPREF9269_0740 [Ligilactobacillus salivarius ACS-116-V-Col5a]|nr:hypothetical protein HMPREF9269_0740 [Ligilactobacillus salivarius ACS-116-V-Col5a]